jgi:oxaloacetate decarboxylase gamma subunit
MPTDLQSALTVLVVGMSVVFLILGLVVLSGKVIISIVNKFHRPEPETKPARRPTPAPVASSKTISPTQLAAIVAAVDQVTAGQGRIQTIEKAE